MGTSSAGGRSKEGSSNWRQMRLAQHKQVRTKFIDHRMHGWTVFLTPPQNVDVLVSGKRPRDSY